MTCATESTLRDLVGVKTDEAALGLLNSAVHALGSNGDVYLPLMTTTFAEIEPRDAVEAMLAAQMTATHVMMTGLANKVMDAPNPSLREAYERSVTRLSRTYLAQMDALKKYRAKAQQIVRVADNPDMFGDFRTGAVQQVAIFEPGGYLADAVSASDIALSDLKSGNVSLYLAFPPDRIASHGAALGLIVNQAITAVARSPKKGEVLFMLDEFANLGKLSGLAESLTLLPGLGVRVWMIVQELAEIVRLYGPHTAKTISTQSEVRQYFAVNSDELAQALSKALGQKTVKTKSHGLGRFDTDDISESLAESGQPLIRAEEIRQLRPDQQILEMKGVRPILGQRIPFWFIAPWRGWAAINPVEGDYPNENPRVVLRYTATETNEERATI